MEDCGCLKDPERNETIPVNHTGCGICPFIVILEEDLLLPLAFAVAVAFLVVILEEDLLLHFATAILQTTPGWIAASARQ